MHHFSGVSCCLQSMHTRKYAKSVIDATREGKLVLFPQALPWTSVMLSLVTSIKVIAFCVLITHAQPTHLTAWSFCVQEMSWGDLYINVIFAVVTLFLRGDRNQELITRLVSSSSLAETKSWFTHQENNGINLYLEDGNSNEWMNEWVIKWVIGHETKEDLKPENERWWRDERSSSSSVFFLSFFLSHLGCSLTLKSSCWWSILEARISSCCHCHECLHERRYNEIIQYREWKIHSLFDTGLRWLHSLVTTFFSLDWKVCN